MLLVPHYIKESPIHGMGLYAGAPIAEGTRVWEFSEGFDRLIPEASLPELHPLTYDFLTRYGHPSRDVPGHLVLEMDHARFLNHSTTPNLSAGIALRDIAEGEELTCDYDRLNAGLI